MRQDVLFHLSYSMVLARRSIQDEVAAVPTRLCFARAHPASESGYARQNHYLGGFDCCLLAKLKELQRGCFRLSI